MADKSSKTEAPTPKRRREARHEGKVAHSASLAGWVTMLALSVLVPRLGSALVRQWESVVMAATAVMAAPTPGGATRLLASALRAVLSASLPIVAAATGLALVSSVGQSGLHLTPKALWKPSRLSPAAGLRRLVSPTGAWTLARTVAELSVLAALGWLAVHQVARSLLGVGTLALSDSLAVAGRALDNLVRYISAGGLLIAIGDWAYQRRRLDQELRMSKHEVKEERRQSEGSPEVRRAQRARQRKLSRSRMLAEVASSAAVIANPTHLSIALAYERGVDQAPRVVAKGLGSAALAIRREARRHGVPVIENRQLAWTMHAACEEGDMVPPHLYQAVAQLLAFVYSLSPVARSLVDVHSMA